jgi:transcriptional regulator with XRE-family HTH domain
MEMGFNLAEIGARVRAYRLGVGFTADDLAGKLGVSRAALYRIEQGEIVKVEVLQSIATILGTSLASLLGVGAEYHSNAASYQARMQQLEENASHIVALFSPLSYLLTTDQYDADLAVMLEESVSPATPQRVDRQAEQRAVLQTLGERRKQVRERKPSITCLTSLEELRRLVTLGLVGRLGLPAATVAERRKAARREVAHLAQLMRAEPVGIQIGLIEDTAPNVAFQLFYKGNEVLLGTSPFRIAELPNLHVGVATITSSPEAVELHVQLFDRLWSLCRRGTEGAKLLEDMLEQHP